MIIVQNQIILHKFTQHVRPIYYTPLYYVTLCIYSGVFCLG